MREKIQKYLRNKASKKERDELEKWLKEDPGHTLLFKKEVHQFHHDSMKNNPVFDKEKAFETVRFASKDKSIKKSKRFYTVGAAASILAVIGVFIFWKFSENEHKNHPESNFTKNVLAENSDQISLTLSDGTVKILNDEQNEVVTNQNGFTIGHQKKNTLSFIKNENVGLKEAKMTQIKVPKGKIFTIILSDGSKVWLNADSSLRFPLQFSDTEKNREVTLVGEAYFEVATHKKQPFLVQTETTKIKVLGTKFNISSYQENNKTTTTLLEGSVVLYVNKVGTKKKMIPGDQILVNTKNHEVKLQKVNAEDYIAWIDDRLLFVNEPFSSLSKKIERSYNVQIQNTYEELNEMHFTGEFDNENVQDILKTFQLSTPFDYIISNNTIKIQAMKKN